MKTVIFITVCLMAGAAVMAAFYGSVNMENQKQASPGKAKVGTHPGDIGTSKDINKTAAERNHELATFAAGCFWGVESEFRQTPGVIATAVGYTGGKTENPTYKEVCSDRTGHAEAVLVEFDPKAISYERLLEIFYEMHDPTTPNRQGWDVGTQYRSAIFYHNEQQKKAAMEFTDKLQRSGKFRRAIVTQIVPEATFWMAEDYHQQYSEKKGIVGCPTH